MLSDSTSLLQEAPHKLITAIERAHGGLKDDTSIIVLDMLPPHNDKDFPTIAGRTKAQNSSRACMCFAPCVPRSLPCFLFLSSVPALPGPLLCTRLFQQHGQSPPGRPCESKELVLCLRVLCR